jgi:hypothetical protein
MSSLSMLALIYLCLPLPSDWTSSDNYKCGTDSDADKMKCSVPLSVTTFSLLLVAGVFGTCGGRADPDGMARKVLNGIAFLFALTATVVFLGLMAITGSYKGGYKWKSFEDAGLTGAAQGYTFFVDFGLLWLMLKYTGSALFNIFTRNGSITKTVFASAVFVYTLCQCIFYWSLVNCRNDDDELQCADGLPIQPTSGTMIWGGSFFMIWGSDSGSHGTGYVAIDDWKVNMVVSAWTIAFAALFCALPAIKMGHSQGGMSSGGLIAVAGLLYFIAQCGTANDAAKWIPDSDYDHTLNDTNQLNRIAAANFFGFYALWAPVVGLVGALKPSDDDDLDAHHGSSSAHHGATTKV